MSVGIMHPLVSVIIPSFDRPLFLKRRSIPSVLRQTYQHWELIIVGDGPQNDALRRVAEGFGDPRISYVEIPRPDYANLSRQQQWHAMGAAARNHGLELSRGAIIAPLDDDDEFLPNHLADCVGTLAAGEYDFVYGYVLVRDIETGVDQSEDWIPWAAPGTAALFRQRNIIFHSSVAYVRAYAGLRYPTDGLVPADYGLWLAIHAAGARFTSLSSPQAIYYGDSLTGTIRVSVPSLPPAEEIASHFKRIFASRMLSNTGPVCSEFEAAAAAYLGVPGVVSTPSGDIGLMLAFRALRLVRACGKREVVLPSYAHPALVNAALWNDFEPVFCDIDPDTLCVTPETIEPKIGPDTAIIAALHPHGNPCDMPALEQLATAYNVALLADAAAAWGAAIGGRRIGGWGDLEVFSLSGTKSLTAGEGGLVCSRDEELLRLVRVVGRYGIGTDNVADTVGLNGKLAELPAALALAGLAHIDAWLRRRRDAEASYRRLLAGVPGLRFPHPAVIDAVSGSKDAVLILPSAEEMQRLRRHLEAYRIASRPYYRPLHRMPAYTHLRADGLAVTERLADCTLCIPLYNDIRDEVIELVADVVRGDLE